MPPKTFDTDLQDQINELVYGRLDAAIPDILQVIIDNDMAGKFQFVRLILELTDKYSHKVTLQGSQPQVGIEQYADLIHQIETWEQECAETSNE